ncbi:(2Fe-2S)-binding protein [Aquibacillus koreensis]|uniref:(2Fe-2S)-binding protein n=1 Tax=Aquibacillus koreensis TaxID=279446 RepID=A0A9X4AII1_9BACI|nr:(2Fe-2S)-binding protein [Aquibacillus koreensis]MCT2537790.1 (2Fe-2S)-binding protein [Aquibacillus koreensis]MDC3421177.1 (2Fe-2S)-binding protein [Aquibacillus koreensis]
MEESNTLSKTETEPVNEQTSISFSLNGEHMMLEVDPTRRLIDILRDDLALTGTKISCGIGRCGACSVLINNQLVNACLVMAYQVDESNITTIETIDKEKGTLPIIQRAFLEEGGFQCGYCTPGMIMAVKSLIDENPNPTEDEIRQALSGNLCRCTGYGGIIRSVERVIRDLQVEV